MGKFVIWKIENDVLEWEFDKEKIYSEQLLDDCYIITGDVPTEEMNADEIVESYKKVRHLETAFRNLKTVMLEIRPVYHKTDDRIKCDDSFFK